MNWYGTFSVATTVLAILGGLTGPLGLIIAFLTYRRDAIHVRVELLRDRIITQGPDDDRVRQMLARYKQTEESPPMALFVRDPDKTWACIEVKNVGRRAITIERIGWTVGPRKHAIPMGFHGTDGWLPATLEEGKRKSFPIEDSQVANALYVWADDSIGNYYYGGFKPSFIGIVARLRIWLRIPM